MGDKGVVSCLVSSGGGWIGFAGLRSKAIGRRADSGQERPQNFSAQRKTRIARYSESGDKAAQRLEACSRADRNRVGGGPIE